MERGKSGMRYGAKFVGAFFHRIQMDYVDLEPDSPWGGTSPRGKVTNVGAPSGVTPGPFILQEFPTGNGLTTENYGAGGDPLTGIRSKRVFTDTVRPPQDIFNRPFPCRIDGPIDGGYDKPVSFRVVVDALGIYPSNSEFDAGSFGDILDRVGFGLFIKRVIGDTADPNYTFVAGGWIHGRDVVLSSDRQSFSFMVYSQTAWMAEAFMREQQYNDPESMAAIAGYDGKAVVAGLQGSLSIDLLGLGYVPQHWLKITAPVVAVHVLSHIRVTYPGIDSTIRFLGRGSGNLVYGNIGQFWYIQADEDFESLAEKQSGGFRDVSLSNGSVYANVTQTLDNERYRYYDRLDGSQRMEKRPQYRTGLSSDWSINLNTEAGEGTRIIGGVQRVIREIQIEKPVLGELYKGTSGGFGYEVAGASNSTRSTYFDTAKQDPAAMRMAVADPMKASKKIDDFLYRYPNPPNASGETIGPLANAFITNLQAFAEGYYKEHRCAMEIELNMMNSLQGDVGDIAAVTVSAVGPFNVSFTGKLFEVTNVTVTIQSADEGVADSYQRVLMLKEIDPDA